jgi:hypothetical protein
LKGNLVMLRTIKSLGSGGLSIGIGGLHSLSVLPVKVQSGGLVSRERATILSGGLVSSQGITVSMGGLAFNSGVTVQSDGVTVVGGTRVLGGTSGNVRVTGGLSVGSK